MLFSLVDLLPGTPHQPHRYLTGLHLQSDICVPEAETETVPSNHMATSMHLY